MENTTPTLSTPSNKKILVFTGLLVLATVFWLWSLAYRDSHVMNDGTMMQGESDLNNEINSSMQSDSEIELKGIDKEF